MMTRRSVLRSILATAALTTGLARASVELVDEPMTATEVMRRWLDAQRDLACYGHCTIDMDAVMRDYVRSIGREDWLA